MKTFTPRSIAAAFTLVALARMLTACGGSDIVIGGGGSGNDKTKVTFKGNLNSVTPVTTRDIVAFVYNITDDASTPADETSSSVRCPCPPDPVLSKVGKAIVMPSGTTEFTISGLTSGTFGVVFLLDNAGNLADGQIDPLDPIAVLDDIDCQLDDVKGNLTVTLKDLDLSFSPAANPIELDPVCKDGVSDPPADGRARADVITVTTTPAAK